MKNQRSRKIKGGEVYCKNSDGSQIFSMEGDNCKIYPEYGTPALNDDGTLFTKSDWNVWKSRQPFTSKEAIGGRRRRSSRRKNKSKKSHKNRK